MKTLDESTIQTLISKAFDMLNFSYVPYSRFTVGAALLAKNGNIYTGCNIENASFGPSNCAERTALFKAVSEGVKDFTAIAIVGGPQKKVNDICSPCGVCRQVMMEFCDPETFQVICAVDKDHYRVRTLKELLPDGFGPEALAAG